MTDLARKAREAAIDHGLWLAPDDDETNYQAFVAGYLRGHSDMAAETTNALDEVEDWRESARKAAEESCGDEKHCACVGPMRHQLVRQARRIVEDAEEIGCLEKLARLAVSLAEQFERAVESRRPISGMSVPSSGDFISCAQLPSAVGRMSWWAREIRRAQTQWSEVGALRKELEG